VDFPKVFLGEHKWKICFLPLETKTTTVFTDNSYPIPTLMRVCKQNSCHHIKISCNFKRFNTILNSGTFLNFIRLMKYLTDQFQLCFCIDNIKCRPIARILQQVAPKTRSGATSFKCNIGCMQEPKGKHEMGGTDFQWGPGITGSPVGDGPD